MNRAQAFLSLALFAATLGMAQTISIAGAGSNSSSPSVTESILRGCLSSSSLGDDHFTLTQDQTGTVFTLTGLTDQLRENVGHQVEVTGEVLSDSTAPDGNHKASGDTGDHALRIKSVRALADHCAASSMDPRGPSPTSATSNTVPIVAEDSRALI